MIHPQLSSSLFQKKSIRLLVKSLSRFIPQPITNEMFHDFSSTDGLLLSQCCFRCLQILHYLIQANKSIVIESLENKSTNEKIENDNNVEIHLNLVVIIVRILVGVERNMIWFPVLLRASEIFQVYHTTI